MKYFLSFVLVFLAIPVFAGDIIVLKNGKRIDNESVEVTGETLKEITYTIKVSGKKTDMKQKASEVERVDYSDAPSTYKKGISFQSQGKYDSAIEQYTQAMQEKKVRNWIKQYASLYIGQCYLALGETNKSNFKEAVKTFEGLLREFPSTRFILEATIGLGDAYAGSGNYAKAEETYNQLVKLVRAENFDKEWELQGELKKCRIFELQEDYNRAIQAYNSLASSASKDSKKISNMAKLQVGKCHIKNKDFSSALGHFGSLKSSSKDDLEVVSGSWAGLGLCYFQQGKYEEAYDAYITYVGQAFYSREEGPSAYYYLAECIEKLGNKKVPNAKKARKWYLTRLVEKFPASSWAEKAREVVGSE